MGEFLFWFLVGAGIEARAAGRIETCRIETCIAEVWNDGTGFLFWEPLPPARRPS